MPPSWRRAVVLVGVTWSCADLRTPLSDGRPPGPAPWVVDPGDPGPNIPPVGRSLFDFLVIREEGGRTVYDVPYPFAVLAGRVGASLGRSESGAPLKMVLIPRGRSLQRDAARPEFFRFPRAVLAVDGEPAAGPGRSGVLLKDRLYLGYQEKANLIEVISYNEAAGRFEFQVVRDYREGGKPHVVYADRALCASCHQNAGPIFPRPLWDETNANQTVAALLAAEGRPFYGFPPHPGVDVPRLIDDATHRANLFSAWQLLWREGCGGAEAEAVRCRAAFLAFVLQYRLSGNRRFDTRSPAWRETFVATIARQGRARWPQGLRIPSPDIPNRNPMLGNSPGRPNAGSSGATVRAGARGVDDKARPAELLRSAEVPAAFEPLLRREPFALWPPPGTEEAGLERAVAGLSEFLADADVRRLDAQLARLGRGHGAARRSHAGACSFHEKERGRYGRRVSFVCRPPEGPPRGADGVFSLMGRLYLEGRRVLSGSIDQVEVDGVEEMPALEVTAGALRAAGNETEVEITVEQAASRLHARRAGGEAVESIVLAWRRGEEGRPTAGRPSPEKAGRGLLRTVDDFGPVRSALRALAHRTTAGELDVLAAKPFRRARVMKALEAEMGLPPLAWCCEDATGMPEPAPDTHPPDQAAAPAGIRVASPLPVFVQYCGRCHETAHPFPPNFLHGTPAEVEAKLAHCAERISFRLEMWRMNEGARPKTPMPPENALGGLSVSREAWPDHPDLHMLQDHVGGILRGQTRSSSSPETLQARGYDNLRACLPEPSPASKGRTPSPPGAGP